MKISIKNIEDTELRLTVDGKTSWLSPDDSREIDFSKSISIDSLDALEEEQENKMRHYEG